MMFENHENKKFRSRHLASSEANLPRKVLENDVLPRTGPAYPCRRPAPSAATGSDGIVGIKPREGLICRTHHQKRARIDFGHFLKPEQQSITG